MLFLFHSVSAKNIEGPTFVRTCAQFHPEMEAIPSLKINYDFVRSLIRWMLDHDAFEASIELVTTIPNNEETILVDIPDDLAPYFKLRWC